MKQDELIVEALTVGVFQENTYILGDAATKEACVIDPGDEAERILERLEANGLTCKQLIYTHAHIDHVLATAAVREATGATIALHAAERELWDGLPMQGQAFGVPVQPLPAPDRTLAAGDEIAVGEALRMSVHETPGHSPGGITFCLPLEDHADLLFVGDALFLGSIGRTDLWGADHETLIRSIKERILCFEDDAVVLSGHGPATTVGQERRTNPFLQ